MKYKSIGIAVSGFLVAGSVCLYATPRPLPRPQRAEPQQGSDISFRPIALLAPTTSSAPNVHTPAVAPSVIVVNMPVLGTITVAITPAPLANSVNLLRLGAPGTQSTILGVLHDDGRNGDAIAGDGVYTLQTSFNEVSAGYFQLQVSAAFQGQLKRVLSPIIPVLVLAPPTGTPFKTNSAILSAGGAVSLDNFGGAYSHGGLLPPRGAMINVGSVPLPITSLPVYINTVELAGSTVALMNIITISGISCTQVFFSDDFGVINNEQAVFCPSGNTLYKFYLTYINGDTNAAQYQVVFQQVLSGAVLPN